MIDSNEQIVHSACKGHTNKSEKELFRICPSKLNKKELEDLYFVVSDNNIQLKKTINSQREQIKVLNTKVQRLSQKTIISSNKECCARSMAVINDQKESIADLKKSNEHLSERIRMLNMRLCSAKQFLRHSPQSSYCAKCFSSNICLKNLSTSALNTKRSEVNLRTAITSSQSFDKENVRHKITKNISTQVEILYQEESCQQNKCRTTIEELTRKIANLKEELSKRHKEYANDVRKLEEEINSVREENIRVRAEHSSSDQKLKAKEKESVNLLQKLRDAEDLYDDVTAQLIIERSKVSELEMQLKATDISKQVAKALEAQMKTSFLIPVPKNQSTSAVKEVFDKSAKNSDDSGFTESIIQENDKKDVVKEENVIQQIMSLQAEVDSLKHLIEKQNTANEQNTDLISNEKGVFLTNPILTNKYFSPSKDDKQSPSKSLIHDNKISKEDVNDQSKTVITQEVKINKDTKIPVPINKTKSNQNEEQTKKVLERSLSKENNNIQSNINKADGGNPSNVRNNENINNDDDETGCKNVINTDLKSSKNHERNDRDERDLDNKQNAKENSDSDLDINNSDLDVVERNANNRTDTAEVLKNIPKNESSENNSSGHNTFVIETKSNNKVDKESNKVNKRPSLDKVTTQNDANLGQSSKLKNDIRVSKPLATSSPSHQTYIVDKSADVRATSPDNTECEISSLTDSPHDLEDKSSPDYISPGEERLTSSYSDSYPTTTTDYYLSEGELPVTNVRNLSLAEVVVKNKTSHPIGHQTVTEMQDAIQAINEEMNRCRDLLQGRKQVIIPSVGRVHTFSYPYNYTFNIE